MNVNVGSGLRATRPIAADARLPQHTPRELRVTTLDVPLPSGLSSRVEIYGRESKMDQSPNDENGASVCTPFGAAVIALSPPSRAGAEADHVFLQSMWAGQTANAGRMARFHLHADEEHDEWSCKASFTDVQLTRVRTLLRSRLFDVWASLLSVTGGAPLARLSGTFEIFNPAMGANMGWHRDGHGHSEFIAHYYLECPSQSGWAVKPSMMDWFEVAMPQHGADDAGLCVPDSVISGPEVGRSDENDDGPSPFALDFGHSDDAERAGVSVDNFLTFKTGIASDQRLVVFEDSRVFHRTPLTAHAAGSSLQSQRRRPIARIVFHGSSSKGVALGFPYPQSAICPSPSGMPADCQSTNSCTGFIGAQPQCIEADLPLGLRRAIEAHAEHTADGNHMRSMMAEDARPAVVSRVASPGMTAANMGASFAAYVAGASSMVGCMSATQMHS